MSNTIAPSWTCLSISGPDTRTFLQGQLSNDVDGLSATQGGFFALCSPKGRVLSNFYLLPSPEDPANTLLFVLPDSVSELVQNTLAKYIVFSKAELQAAPRWQISCVAANCPSVEVAPAKQAFACALTDEAAWLRINNDETRYLSLRANDAEPPSQRLSDNAWSLADIRAGIGLIRSETSDQFVPQMLNMQLTNGVSFTKGCYTGQEIVARAQYRGKIKRRMIRASLNSDQLPARGSEVLAVDSGKSIGAVVDAAQVDADHYELLAVVSLGDQSDIKLSHADNELQVLPLPYSDNGNETA